MAQVENLQEFLYRIQVVRPAQLSEGPTEREDELTMEHFNYLKHLAAEGTLVIAGRTQTTDYSSFGLIIFRAADEAAARGIVANDPAVKAGMFRAELYPYRIAVVGELNS